MIFYRRRVVVTAVLVIGLTLTGCSGTQDADVAAPDSTPPTASHEPSASPEASVPVEASAEPGSSYENLDALKAALEATGVDCSLWTQDDSVSGALESGWCSDQWGLSTYASRSEVSALLDVNWSSSEPQPFLAGDNWLITRGYGEVADLDAVQLAIGGTLLFPGDDYPV